MYINFHVVRSSWILIISAWDESDLIAVWLQWVLHWLDWSMDQYDTRFYTTNMLPEWANVRVLCQWKRL